MIIIQRLNQAILTPLTGKDWLVILISLFTYGWVALLLGYFSRFIQFNPYFRSPKTLFSRLIKIFFFPALVEEIIFRVLLIPHPLEAVDLKTWVFWVLLSLGLFILYHPLNAITFYPEGNPTFFHPIFLSLAAFLGLICAVVYKLTGSLWGIVIIHGLVVFIWLYFLDGITLLNHRNDSEF